MYLYASFLLSSLWLLFALFVSSSVCLYISVDMWLLYAYISYFPYLAYGYCMLMYFVSLAWLVITICLVYLVFYLPLSLRWLMITVCQYALFLSSSLWLLYVCMSRLLCLTYGCYLPYLSCLLYTSAFQLAYDYYVPCLPCLTYGCCVPCLPQHFYFFISGSNTRLYKSNGRSVIFRFQNL